MRSRGRNSTEFPLPPTGGASPISPRPPALVKASRSIDPRNPPLTSQFVHSRAPCPNAVSGSILGRFGTATQETPSGLSKTFLVGVVSASTTVDRAGSNDAPFVPWNVPSGSEGSGGGELRGPAARVSPTGLAGGSECKAGSCRVGLGFGADAATAGLITAGKPLAMAAMATAVTRVTARERCRRRIDEPVAGRTNDDR